METDTINKMGGWLLVGSTLLTIVVFTLIGYKHGLKSAVVEVSEFVDTIYIRDTFTQYKPIFEERVVLKNVPVPVTDTLTIHDTLYVYLDREQVVWQDTLSRVYVSGIMPQIDSVQHFIREVIVTMEKTRYVKKPCRWGVGIHAGYGIQLGEQFKTAPYIGMGVSYNILSW